MRVVETLTKRQAWRLTRLGFEDGRTGFLTCFGMRDAMRAARGDAWASPILQGWRIAQVEAQDQNVVVEGSLRPLRQAIKGGVWLADEDGVEYYANYGAFYDMATMALDGRLRTDGGRYVGRFTFRAVGSTVTITPCAADDLPAAPSGVPDLSDFIAALQPRVAGPCG